MVSCIISSNKGALIGIFNPYGTIQLTLDLKKDWKLFNGEKINKSQGGSLFQD